MGARFAFDLKSNDSRRKLPGRIIIGQQDTETIHHVGLKLIAYLYFYRERILLETNLHNANIPFIPDLVQLDYELKPILWIECGDCGVNKLNKLAVKTPDAELWVMKKSHAAADDLVRAMHREELRRGRYNVMSLDPEMFDEICGMIANRNPVHWFKADAEASEMHFEFNGLWFELPFRLVKF